MSLRLQVHLIITVLLLALSSLLIGLQIDNTRRSVREEVSGANMVAAQLLSRVEWIHGQGGVQAMAGFLHRVGRVRANEIELYDAEGQLIYRSPPTRYKAGRDAPAWYAAIVSPPLEPRVIELAGGRVVLRADPSRAALDGWDELTPMLWLVLAGFLLVNALIYVLVGRALRPLQLIVRGLHRMEQGDWDARLPALTGREGRLIGQAFNRMAQSVQDSVQARREAREAEQALAHNRELTQLIHERIEHERAAIARELHDELGQQVTAIKSIGLSIAQRAAGQDAQTEQSARLVMDCADQIYDGVHRLIARLRPLALDRFGLRDALQDLLADCRLHHPEIRLTLTVDAPLETLDEVHATAVYRIVQEAVSNALRHADADRIDIGLAREGAALTLQVRDNGRAPASAYEARGHYGVAGMRERAQALGGSFAIEPGPEGGTRARVRLPAALHEENGGTT